MVCEDTAGDRVDSGGDGCSWYEGNTEYCGMFADDDFNSNDHCCVCGGGAEIAVPAQAPEVEPLEVVCLDTNGEATNDTGSDGCSWY